MLWLIYVLAFGLQQQIAYITDRTVYKWKSSSDCYTGSARQYKQPFLPQHIREKNQ